MILERQQAKILAELCEVDHDYPMTISSKDRRTTLPSACALAESDSRALSSISHLRMKSLCPVRMAEAERADAEVVALAEELSQLMRKPLAKKVQQERPRRGNSDRPSVCRRKPRKAR